jgi:hypothetical protein
MRRSDAGWPRARPIASTPAGSTSRCVGGQFGPWRSVRIGRFLAAGGKLCDQQTPSTGWKGSRRRRSTGCRNRFAWRFRTMVLDSRVAKCTSMAQNLAASVAHQREGKLSFRSCQPCRGEHGSGAALMRSRTPAAECFKSEDRLWFYRFGSWSWRSCRRARP